MSGRGSGEQQTEATAAGQGVRHHLVLANQTIGSIALRDALVERARAPGASFHLVVPATRISDQQQALVASEHLRSIQSEDASVALARHRLERALADLRKLGLDVTGDVGDADPCDAVRSALQERSAVRLPDEIIVSTLPVRSSRWVASGLVRRIRRGCPIPVTHVEARPTVIGSLRTARRPEVVAP